MRFEIHRNKAWRTNLRNKCFIVIDRNAGVDFLVCGTQTPLLILLAPWDGPLTRLREMWATLLWCGVCRAREIVFSRCLVAKRSRDYPAVGEGGGGVTESTFCPIGAAPCFGVAFSPRGC